MDALNPLAHMDRGRTLTWKLAVSGFLRLKERNCDARMASVDQT